MLEVYHGRRGPQPLGTVVFEEIEEKARKKLKELGYESKFTVIQMFFLRIVYINRCFLVRWWKCWYKFHLSR